MTEKPVNSQNAGNLLADFQARFVQQFLQPAAAPFQLLSGPVGAGKTFTAATIASLTWRSGGQRRALVLCPAALTCAWGEALCRLGDAAGVLVVDRRLFRELESRVPVGESPWPAGIIVISQDTAKRPDVASSLATTSWDLVVVDEAHQIAGLRQRLMEGLMESGNVRRLLLVTATPKPDRFSSLVPALTVTDWTPELLQWRKAHATEGAVSQEPLIVYRRADDEVAFLEALREVGDELVRDSSGRLLCQLLLRNASSCVFSAEQMLLRARRRLESVEKGGPHALEANAGLVAEPEADTDWSEEEPTAVPWHSVPSARGRIDELVDLVEAVRNDEKFRALERLLADLMPAGKANHVCIITDFAATAEYLSMNLGEDSRCYEVTGIMLADHCIEQTRAFAADGGILVGTTAALQGFDLAFVEAVVHYDLPISATVMEQRIGRVNRIGRAHACRMYAFLDESGVLPLETVLLRRHGWLRTDGGPV